MTRKDGGVEFSWIGLGVASAVLLPNLVFLVAPPRGTLPHPRLPLPITLSERVGQIGCLALAVFTAGPLTLPWVMLLLGAALAIAGYWALWIRYTLGGRTPELLYGPIGTLPIPLAVLPALAFGLTAIWGLSIALGVAAIVFAVGHWTTAASIARELSERTGRAQTLDSHG